MKTLEENWRAASDDLIACCENLLPYLEIFVTRSFTKDEKTQYKELLAKGRKARAIYLRYNKLWKKENENQTDEDQTNKP